MNGIGTCQFPNSRRVTLKFTHSYPAHVRSAMRVLCGLLLTVTLLFVMPHMLEMAAMPDMGADGGAGADVAGVVDGGAGADGQDAAQTQLTSPETMFTSPSDVLGVFQWPWAWLWPWSDQQLKARALAQAEAAIVAAHGLQGAHIHGLWSLPDGFGVTDESSRRVSSAGGFAASGANHSAAIAFWNAPAKTGKGGRAAHAPGPTAASPFAAYDAAVDAAGHGGKPWRRRWDGLRRSNVSVPWQRGAVLPARHRHLDGTLGGHGAATAATAAAAAASTRDGAAAGANDGVHGNGRTGDASRAVDAPQPGSTPSTVATVLSLYMRLHLKRQLHYLRLGMMVLFTLTGDLEDAMAALAWPILCSVCRFGHPNRPWTMVVNDTLLFWVGLVVTSAVVGTLCAFVIVVLPEGLSEVLRLVSMAGLSARV